MLRIVNPHTDPFTTAIGRFLQQEFPTPLPGAHPDLLELLSSVIMGTKQTRYGPKPSPEAQVNIRNVIRHWLAKGEPIPFLVPWGSQKPDGSSIDIAEVGAIRTLDCLHGRVAEHYAPGLVFNVRLEDASAPYLYKENADAKRAGALRYKQAMESLTRVLGVQSRLRMMPEGALVTEAKFAEEAQQYEGLMRDTIDAVIGRRLDKEHQFELLSTYGWGGGIAPETVNFYLQRYARLYPERSVEYNIGVLARYFAGALARKRLGVRGDCPAWEGKYIELSFAPIVPGTDTQFDKRVQYRTFPTHLTKGHMPPWRSKGFLRINGDGDVTPDLRVFSDDGVLNTHVLTVEGNDHTVNIQSDYILE